MVTKDLKHINLESQKSKVESQKSEDLTNSFITAEGIELKETYSEKDIENLEFLDFGAGFSP